MVDKDGALTARNLESWLKSVLIAARACLIGPTHRAQDMLQSANDRCPILVIGGHGGSGKTTFLHSLQSLPRDPNTFVVYFSIRDYHFDKSSSDINWPLLFDDLVAETETQFEKQRTKLRWPLCYIPLPPLLLRRALKALSQNEGWAAPLARAKTFLVSSSTKLLSAAGIALAAILYLFPNLLPDSWASPDAKFPRYIVGSTLIVVATLAVWWFGTRDRQRLKLFEEDTGCDLSTFLSVTGKAESPLPRFFKENGSKLFAMIAADIEQTFGDHNFWRYRKMRPVFLVDFNELDDISYAYDELADAINHLSNFYSRRNSEQFLTGFLFAGQRWTGSSDDLSIDGGSYFQVGEFDQSEVISYLDLAIRTVVDSVEASQKNWISIRLNNEINSIKAELAKLDRPQYSSTISAKAERFIAPAMAFEIYLRSFELLTSVLDVPSPADPPSERYISRIVGSLTARKDIKVDDILLSSLSLVILFGNRISWEYELVASLHPQDIYSHSSLTRALSGTGLVASRGSALSRSVINAFEKTPRVYSNYRFFPLIARVLRRHVEHTRYRDNPDELRCGLSLLKQVMTYPDPSIWDDSLVDRLIAMLREGVRASTSNPERARISLDAVFDAAEVGIRYLSKPHETTGLPPLRLSFESRSAIVRKLSIVLGSLAGMSQYLDLSQANWKIGTASLYVDRFEQITKTLASFIDEPGSAQLTKTLVEPEVLLRHLSKGKSFYTELDLFETLLALAAIPPIDLAEDLTLPTVFSVWPKTTFFTSYPIFYSLFQLCRSWKDIGNAQPFLIALITNRLDTTLSTTDSSSCFEHFALTQALKFFFTDSDGRNPANEIRNATLKDYVYRSLRSQFDLLVSLDLAIQNRLANSWYCSLEDVAEFPEDYHRCFLKAFADSKLTPKDATVRGLLIRLRYELSSRIGLSSIDPLDVHQLRDDFRSYVATYKIAPAFDDERRYSFEDLAETARFDYSVVRSQWELELTTLLNITGQIRDGTSQSINGDGNLSIQAIELLANEARSLVALSAAQRNLERRSIGGLAVLHFLEELFRRNHRTFHICKDVYHSSVRLVYQNERVSFEIVDAVRKLTDRIKLPDMNFGVLDAYRRNKKRFKRAHLSEAEHRSCLGRALAKSEDERERCLGAVFVTENLTHFEPRSEESRAYVKDYVLTVIDRWGEWLQRPQGYLPSSKIAVRIPRPPIFFSEMKEVDPFVDAAVEEFLSGRPLLPSVCKCIFGFSPIALKALGRTNWIASDIVAARVTSFDGSKIVCEVAGGVIANFHVPDFSVLKRPLREEKVTSNWHLAPAALWRGFAKPDKHESLSYKSWKSQIGIGSYIFFVCRKQAPPKDGSPVSAKGHGYVAALSHMLFPTELSWQKALFTPIRRLIKVDSNLIRILRSDRVLGSSLSWLGWRMTDHQMSILVRRGWFSKELEMILLLERMFVFPKRRDNTKAEIGRELRHFVNNSRPELQIVDFSDKIYLAAPTRVSFAQLRLFRSLLIKVFGCDCGIAALPTVETGDDNLRMSVEGELSEGPFWSFSQG